MESVRRTVDLMQQQLGKDSSGKMSRDLMLVKDLDELIGTSICHSSFNSTESLRLVCYECMEAEHGSFLD